MLSTLKTNISLFRAHIYDFARYRKFSFVSQQSSRSNRRAKIRIYIHYLEGGMCFPDVRLGYGQDKAKSVLGKLQQYVRDFEVDETVGWAVATLKSYFEFHRERDHDLTELRKRFETLTHQIGVNDLQSSGGYETVTAQNIRSHAMIDFQKFMETRHSVRQYAQGGVEPKVIRNIVKNAVQCPSVCNRQTCKVYALTELDSVQQVLSYQAGNAGFRQEIQTLFVITANIGEMNLIGERYQGWIDGGIFAMSLALSIHAEGLGACFLNWSTEPDQDRALRKCLNIPDNELVITMMSAGHLKPEFQVPLSRRKSLDEVLVLNPSLA